MRKKRFLKQIVSSKLKRTVVIVILGCMVMSISWDLQEVYVSWATPLSIQDNIFFSGTISTARLYVPAGTRARYQAANVWRNFGTIIER